MANWKLPIDDSKLPDLGGELTRRTAELANVIRKDMARSIAQENWLRAYDARRRGEPVPIDPPERPSFFTPAPRTSAAAPPLDPHLDDRFFPPERTAIESPLRPTSHPVGAPASPPRIIEATVPLSPRTLSPVDVPPGGRSAQEREAMFARRREEANARQAPRQEDPDEINENAAPAEPSAPPPRARHVAPNPPDEPPREPPPIFVDRTPPNRRLPIGIHPRPSYMPPPEPPEEDSEEEDEEDVENSRELVINAGHLHMLMEQNRAMGEQMISAMAESIRQARASADDARRNAEISSTTAQRMAKEAIDNGSKLASAAITLLTAATDSTKGLMQSMDNRMQKAEDARLASMDTLERALITEGRAQAVLNGHGIPTPPQPAEMDDNTKMMGDLFGVAIAKGGGFLVDKIASMMTGGQMAMTPEGIKRLIAEGIAEGIAKGGKT